MTMKIERVEADRFGGQVPLLKHSIMQWLQLAHQRSGGHIHGDSYDIANDTRASATNVSRALWDLQKQGLLTFSERKRSGINGHGSSTMLTRFQLTPVGLTWSASKATMTDMVGVGTYTEADINPSLLRELQEHEVAEAITDANIVRRVGAITETIMAANQSSPPPQCTCGHPEGTILRHAEHVRGCPWAAAMEARVEAVRALTPTDLNTQSVAEVTAPVMKVIEATKGDDTVQNHVSAPRSMPQLLNMPAPAALLRLLAAEGEMPVRAANEAMGYKHDSTALYSLSKTHPGGFVLTRGRISLTPEAKAGKWEPPTNGKMAAVVRPRHGHGDVAMVTDRLLAQTMVGREATASVALDHDPDEGTQSMPPVTIHLPALGPEITLLLARAGKRAKVTEAVAALEAAGLDEDALTVLGRIPDDSPLEREVLALVSALDYPAEG